MIIGNKIRIPLATKRATKMIRGLKHLCNAPAHSAVLEEGHLIYSDKCTGEATKILRSSNNKLVINSKRVNRVNIFFPISPFWGSAWLSYRENISTGLGYTRKTFTRSDVLRSSERRKILAVESSRDQVYPRLPWYSAGDFGFNQKSVLLCLALWLFSP